MVHKNDLIQKWMQHASRFDFLVQFKGTNMDVIISSLSLMAASLLALVRGSRIAISTTIMQAVIAAVMW